MSEVTSIARDGSAAHRCRSRDVNGEHPAVAAEGDCDTWCKEANGDLCCSYCGSLHPEDFIRLVKKSSDPSSDVSIDSSTKGYKFYIRRPDVVNAAEGGIKFYNWHFRDQSDVDRVNTNLRQAVDESEKRNAALIRQLLD